MVPLMQELPDVLLLAAGFGSRLRPLTDSLPKALVALDGVSLLERHLQALSEAGFRKVFINVHYLAQQIIDFAGSGERWGLDIVYSWEPELLDTAGALRPLARHVQGRELLLVNADSLFLDPAPYSELVSFHRDCKGKALASMLLRKDEASKHYGALLCNTKSRQIEGFLKSRAPAYSVEQNSYQEYMYCGIQLLSFPDILNWLPARNVCSITADVLQVAVAAGEQIFGFEYSGSWHDVGTPERLQSAEQEAKRRRLKASKD